MTYIHNMLMCVICTGTYNSNLKYQVYSQILGSDIDLTFSKLYLCATFTKPFTLIKDQYTQEKHSTSRVSRIYSVQSEDHVHSARRSLSTPENNPSD